MCYCEEIIQRLRTIENLVRNLQPESPKRWLGAEDAANYIGKKKSTIYRMTMNNEIPHYKHGRKLMFLQSELDNHISEHKTKPRPAMGIKVEK